MSRRLVVLTDSLTKEQENAFRKFITERDWGFWHWLPGSWLLEMHDHVEDPCVVVRDELLKIAGNVHTFVFEVTGVSQRWTGYGPQTEKSNMFTWINENWTPTTSSE